ncbi:LOW QUALITY PROTEIN: RRM_XMAS2 and SAC3_GANP domain-containing protein xmas [Aphomia sociella]
MDPTSPVKKIKSPTQETLLNAKTSITCTNVPDSLFDATAAKKHFCKFGRVQKIRLFPKKHMCIIEYDQPSSTQRALLNAGAYEGNMFDVTRTKARMRRKSKKDDDPDWLPDSDVEEELAAMGGAATYRVPRQKPMEIENEPRKINPIRIIPKQSPLRKKIPVRDKSSTSIQSASGIESPVSVTATQTSMSTVEAAAELHQLRSKVSSTPDEQWRTLDARDRILRAWGGAGSRVKVGGATIGTCPDMCPEKELLHRQAEHQVMTLESVPGSDGQLEPWRAVKQYSRSSADQEIPMCYELRPAPVLMRTCSYILHEIADTKRQVTLSDWFHFMWDRFRGIRKDITQQALCCSESIQLVEMCARFHAHCAARLADLEHTQFDQKLNTDNLTKCLQTLKHMYTDVGPEQKPREAEFRGYIALLNLGDANFWWEIKRLPQKIQKSKDLIFAIKIFNALDNNNYIKFFRLVRDEATYLQACILLRYFNDVRARALARIVKAYAPRGGSRYPAQELMDALAFESVENMKSFISHYGLRIGKDEYELSVILDRNQFIDDSDPFPISRAINLIESKRHNTVGEIIAGGKLPQAEYSNHTLYSSFTSDGRIKESALTAEDYGFNTINDSNKDVRSLKAEIQRLSQGGRGHVEKLAEKTGIRTKPEIKLFSSTNVNFNPTVNKNIVSDNTFLFKPAIPVASSEVIANSPEKIFASNDKSKFIFSPPQEPLRSIFSGKLNSQDKSSKQLPNWSHESKFDETDSAKSIFGRTDLEKKVRNIFTKGKDEFKFIKPDSTVKSGNIGNIFTKPVTTQEVNETNPSNIFGNFVKVNKLKPETSNIFSSSENDNTSNDFNKLSPSSLFKSACKPVNGSEPKAYSIFQTKNKDHSIAANIFKSVNASTFDNVYDFNEYDGSQKLEENQRNEENLKDEEERKLQEKLKKEEEMRILQEMRKQEERRKEDMIRRQEQEEKRMREEERKQEELKKKLEEEKKAAYQAAKLEQERKFEERVCKESSDLIEELLDEIKAETVTCLMKEEIEKLNLLVSHANKITEEIITEINNEICHAEMTAEKFRTDKVLQKWYNVWKRQVIRNIKRRNLLEDTPVWLVENTPIEEAAHLRRAVENAALKNMNAFHRGYRFTGELKQLPTPESYNLMEIIKSPLLKRMKQINYPYDKCFFWKITVASPTKNKWLCRKIDMKKWILDAFSDKMRHDVSETLIHVKKQSWNNLMDFAISVSLINEERNDCSEALEGTNGLLFYFTESETTFAEIIQETLKHKYPYQVIPVTVILPKKGGELMHNIIEELLTNFVNDKVISAFKILIVDSANVFDSLNGCTKSALKWMAKKCPQNPVLEIDFLKSICQRYLGNEIWYRLKSESDSRMSVVLKDLHKLVECYNVAVDKLTEVITNEDLFNYPSFPLEFKVYLNNSSPYPKPYEFIPSNAKNAENVSSIKDFMKQLKLPDPVSDFQPYNVPNMQQQIRKYCNQIGCFENPEEVVCKVVAVLPNEFSDVDMPREEFNQYFSHYDLVDVLNVIVYEKINRLNNFCNRFAVYEKLVLEEYRKIHWLLEIGVLCKMKHKAIEYEDELDLFIDTKRRKVALDSVEYLMLEDRDSTLVEENIKATEENISKYNNCEEAVKQLERQIDEEKQKSMELENLLRVALSDVY